MSHRTTALGVVGVGAVVAGAVATRRGSDAGPSTRPDGTQRWLVVTVDKPIEELTGPGALPRPLARLGDSIEVSTRRAPSDRGTEVAVRLRSPGPSRLRGAAQRLAGRDPRGDLRRELRRSKHLLEVGEELRMDPRPAGRRGRTPAGLAMAVTTGRASREGVL